MAAAAVAEPAAAVAAEPAQPAVEQELSAEQANKAFPKLMQWLEYIAEQDCHKLRARHCMPEDKGKTMPKPVKQLPYNNLRRLLYVVGSTNWKRVRRTLIIGYAKRIVQALNDHAEEWRLTPYQLVVAIVERDGYSMDGSVPVTTFKQYPCVEMPKMEQARIATLALDVWITDDADNECFRIREIVCGGSVDTKLPANALRRLLFDYPAAYGGLEATRATPAAYGGLEATRAAPATYLSPRTPQWKRVRSSVIATNRQRILDWLITHQQTWRDPFDPLMTETIIY